MKRLVSLGLCLGLAAGCGDNIKPTADTDAADIDAAVDAPIDADDTDAPPPQYTATMTLLETEVLAPMPAPANTLFGQGMQFGITFTDNQAIPAPVLDTQPGTLFGCKVSEYTPAQYAASLGIDEGPVAVSTTATSGANAVAHPCSNPAMCACAYVAGSGYICPDVLSSGAGNGTSLAPGASGTSVFTTSGAFQSTDVGYYVRFADTGLPIDGAAFPIVAVPTDGGGTAVLATGTGLTLTITAGTYTVLAGVGPTPSVADPGFLADDGSGTYNITAASTHFGATAITFGNIGDDFDQLVDATHLDLRAIPTDGSAFTIGCDSTECPAGSAIGTVLSIFTTDSTLDANNPFHFPAPTTKRVSIRCAQVGPTELTVPANVSAYIQNSGATRIQALLIRANFGAVSPANDTITAIGGHALVGFTTP